MILSPNVAKVKPSITLAITAQAKAMKAQGIDVISMSAGEPDFDTPQHICDAAVESISKGYTRYTPSSGISELKQAVCEKFKNDNGLEYKPSQVIINSGAKHSVYLAVMALISPGDEVIIPSPYWVSYPEMVILAGGTPVIIEGNPKHDMKVTAGQIESAITPKTKLIIINSPSNPTGVMYKENELRAIVHVIEKAGIFVLSDEIYEKLVYGSTRHISLASLSDGIYQKTITVNGVSKSYCMTGWRIGYTAGPEEIIRGMDTIQSQETSNPCSISQWAALAALKGPQECVTTMVKEYNHRRQYITDRLNRITGVTCIEPTGAFYVFPDVSSYYGKRFQDTVIDGSASFCNYMLQEQRIALVPGIGFGNDKYVRLSYATSLDNIVKALDRFKKGLEILR